MDPKKAIEALQKLALGALSPKALLAVGILLPLLAAGAALLWKRLRRKREEPPPVEIPADAAPAPSPIGAAQLRRAWLRFLAPLPATYRRSILNFEHFVVLGDASSGKSRVIDACTDWRRQSKQFLGSQAFDEDLPVYLASGAVVMEIPARILNDHSARCRSALERLWRPLYKRRSPTVVVVVDVVRLRESTVDAVADLAERLRGKINLLSHIRKRPVDVRIVLTHLDRQEGWTELGRLAETEKIPLRVSLEPGAETSTRVQIAAWTERARSHLARALVHESAPAFRRIVAFLRDVPDLLLPTAHFVDVLFAREALSSDPRCEGLYLSTLGGGAEPNPFRAATETGAGPDPRVKHAVFVAAAAGLALFWWTAAFLHQRALFETASTAFVDYKPSMVGSEAERIRREALGAFAWRATGVTTHHPDFFGAPRERLRAAVSERIRSDLLVPNLRVVAERGALGPKELLLPWRRALFYLAVIHGDRYDGMHILDPDRLEIWAGMTELPPDIIRDYLTMTDEAYAVPVAFTLSHTGIDPHDQVAFWTSFMREIGRVMDARAIGRSELKALQAEALDVSESLDRFAHDDLVKTIAQNLDDAASIGPRQREAVELETAYRAHFEEVLANLKASDIFEQRDQMRAVLRAVRAANIEPPRLTLLSELDDYLAALYESPLEPLGSEDVDVRLAGEEYRFEAKRWSEVLRNSRADNAIGELLKPAQEAASIFFGPGTERDLRPIVWNHTNDGTSIFLGRGSIDGRYTRSAFDKFVHEPIARLDPLLGKAAGVPEDRRRMIVELVKDHVEKYAAKYHGELLGMLRAFSLSAPSTESLRVALAQMVSDQSEFGWFVTAMDRQVDLPMDGEMLDPMRGELGDAVAWHKLLDTSSGAAEIGKYRAILEQMLADLGPSDTGGLDAGGEEAAEGDRLETSLSAAGRLTLKSFLREGGSYAALVGQWVSSVHLPAYEQGPFLAPIVELERIGRQNIEDVVARAWQRDVMGELSKLLGKFPFDREATEEATPRDIDALLNPVSGKFFALFRRYFEPVSEIADGSPFRERATLRGRLTVPPDMYAMVNGVAALASTLYDVSGRPSPLPVRVATTPFVHGTDPHAALTLVYLSIADAHVYNFNQKPGLVTIRFDWTQEHTAQVGVQLTNLDTKENLYPEPINSPSSHWAILRLLAMGHAESVKRPEGGTMYSWVVPHGTGLGEKTTTRFVVVGDPWQPFSFAARLGSARTLRMPASR